jgi:hypothetical protein
MTHEKNKPVTLEHHANPRTLKHFLEKQAAIMLAEAGSEEKFLDMLGKTDPYLSQEGKEFFLSFAKAVPVINTCNQATE